MPGRSPSVVQFDAELKEISSLGYTSAEYGDVYTHMVRTYNRTLGEKKAIISFLLTEDGEIIHSSEHNESFLIPLLSDEENKKLIDNAFASHGNGEITARRDGKQEELYYHYFYSGPNDYTLFMCVDKQAVEADLHVHGVVVPICLIGLLMLFVIEFGIYHIVQDDVRDREEQRKREEADHAD